MFQFVKFLVKHTRKISMAEAKTFTYPKAVREEKVTDDFFGIKVFDPYRWLENPESEDTQQFIQEQNAISEPYFEECPYRDKIRSRLIDLWDYPKFSTPLLRGQKYFQVRNSGLENQGSLYVSDDLNSEGTLLINPNDMSEDGTVALSDVVISEDNKTCAYSCTSKGSDWTEIRFKDVTTGRDYPEVLTKIKFSAMTWMHDNVGFFYSGYLNHNGTEGSETTQVTNQKLYYHKLNTSQSEDVAVVVFDNPEYVIGAKVSHCGNYLIVEPCRGCKTNLLYYVQLPKDINGMLNLIPLVTEFTADFHYVTNVGTNLLILTDKNAPNKKIISIDMNNPKETKWKDLIPETDNVLVWAKPIHNDKLVLCYMKDVKHVLQLNDLNTGAKLHEFENEVGTIEKATGRKSDSQMFYSFTSFTTPKVVHRISFESDQIKDEVVQEAKLGNECFDDITVRQVFYKSKDATTIPMFLIHKKTLELNGKNPCLLYGYGGFNISITSNFSLARLLWARNFRGVVAIANIRGGGEYGDKWHRAGRFESKQNCFDDFQYAARYLIGTNYTCPSKLAIEGVSNGGLLVGACINQAPELFGAAVAHVGVMDMLRFHKFTIGYAWKTEYGSAEDPVMFPHIYKYSPLHNVNKPLDLGVQYPSTLLLTADHDDRVVPLHSLKFIAELQHKIGALPNQRNPLLIKVETSAGHGGGKPTTKKIEELTDIFCFLANSLNLAFFE